MMLALFAALALVAAPDPTPEALALGKRLAEAGTLAALLPVMVAKDREEILAEHPEWGEADKAAFRATAGKVAAAGVDRLMTATGRAYATRLDVADLRALVAFHESAAAKRWREAMPAAMIEAMTVAGEIDFKKDVLKAFCAETGKGC